MNKQRLPFWSFFEEIEKALSYERWIDKYRLFLDTLLGNHIEYDKDWFHFKQFCKVLYLQDHHDEEKFEQLLVTAIAREGDWLMSLLHKEAPQEKPSEDNKESVGGNGHNNEPAAKDPVTKDHSVNGEESVVDKTGINDNRKVVEEKSMYYSPLFTSPGVSEKPVRLQPVNFLLTDEYFPVSRRQMVKAWQFLRLKEKGGLESGIDIPGTVIQIAKDGLFLQPVYKSAMRNREGTLIIFADYRGSMTPFHELTNRLIETARGEGGHPRAPVYYFKNYPVGYVYQQSNLTEPVKIKQALSKCNRNFTLAVVISDAGAARGNTDKTAVESRESMTEEFLKLLDESCAHTIWLNPMPVHRWKNTAAEKIREKGYIMAPILEHDNYDFQDTLRTIIKQNIKAVL